MNLRTCASGSAPMNWLTGWPSLNATTVGSERICGHEIPAVRARVRAGEMEGRCVERVTWTQSTVSR